MKKYLFVVIFLSINGCLPVKYDSQVWNRIETTPRETNGIYIFASILPSSTDFLNSASKGPWFLSYSFRSEGKNKIELTRATVKASDTAQNRIVTDFSRRSGRDGQNFKDFFQSENPISVRHLEHSTVEIVLEFTIDGKSKKLKNIFRADSVEGTESVNFLTM